MKLLYWRSDFHSPLLHHAINGRIINSFIPKLYKKNYYKIEEDLSLTPQDSPVDLFIAETGRVFFTNRDQNRTHPEILVPSLSPDFSPKPKASAIDYEKLDSFYKDLNKYKLDLLIYFYISYLGRLPDKTAARNFLSKKNLDIQAIFDLRCDMINSNEFKDFTKQSSLIPGFDLRFFLNEKGPIHRAVKSFLPNYL
jgi:hypothetical protein